MKIAVTSQNYRTVTGHAGLTRKLLVFDVACSEDGKSAARIEEVERIALPKENSLHNAKQGQAHPIDVADVVLCGSCGEGFIRKMGGRGITVSVTTKTDPLEAVAEYLEKGAEHSLCADGPHHSHEHKHAHGEGHSCGCGGGCSCHEETKTS